MIALDGSTSLWILGLLSFLLGSFIGCILTYTIVARNNRTHQLQIELNELTNDFRDYRDQVTHHFMRSSELVQVMTQSYRAVYEHLASGAQHLCGDNEAAALHHASTSRVTAAGAPYGNTGADDDYDELEELAKIRNDIDELLGESPRVPDVNAKPGKDSSLQH
ncbi:MAG TPA: DUF1043 family protein [Gammaproteobacteria bacterium]|jgi:uncharacterized membrane-anchored protein YhcB (DUF1043 family)|nr:DUF1043 family protein [Gammaproteobacteria bacterium]